MSAETGVTNLGPVPEDMTFIEAIRATRALRKFTINPLHHSRRLTLCETMREVFRETQKDVPDMDKIRDLASAGFDFGKRMNARLVELKEITDA